MKTKNLLMLACVVCSLFYAAPLQAEGKNEETKTEQAKTEQAKTEQAPVIPAKKPDIEIPTIEPGDVAEFESKGLWHSRDEGALSANLWRSAKRSSLVRLIENLGPPPQNKTLQDLYFGTLLSRADARQIENDVEIKNGGDLLSLRLEKLNGIGAYNHASGLYSKIKDEPYHPRLAKAGIIAHMMNSESSLACLELQITDGLFASNILFEDFHKNIEAFCDRFLNDEVSKKTTAHIKASKDTHLKKALQDEGYKTPYDPQALSKLAPFTRAALIAGNHLDLSTLKDIKPDDIPSTDLVFLIQNPDIWSYRKIVLSAEALKRGLLTPGDMAETVNAITLPATGAKTDESGLNSSEKFALYYREANKASGKERREYINKALAMSSKFGIHALTPFADLLKRELKRELKHENRDAFSADTLIEIIRILHAADIALPRDVFEILEKKYEKPENLKKEHYGPMLAAYLSRPVSNKSDTQPPIITHILDNSNAKEKEFYKIIMKTLDKNMSNVDTALEAYEKDFNLTLSLDYVMPSHNVWKHLIIASKNKSTAEMSLLSTYVFRDRKPEELYPGLWRDVLHGLDAVGLNEYSKELAVSALLEEK